MNKDDILKILLDFDFNKKEILILSGASMVLNDIKEKTYDIDLAVSSSYEKELLEKYNCKLKEQSNDCKVYTIDDVIDFSTNYYDFDYDMINGYKVQKPKEVLKLKKILNRDKDKKDIKLIEKYLILCNTSSLALAYLGDSIYEFYIRKHLIFKGITKVNELQKEAIGFVSAKSQSGFLEKMLDDNFLTSEEITIIKRARNHKSHASKTADIITYKKSTGLEALIGYLYLKSDISRIEEIINYIVGD